MTGATPERPAAMEDPAITTARLRALRGRRTRRVGFIWILVGVVLVGNAWDIFGGHSWGPAQSTTQGVTVHASAFLFWVAVGMFCLTLRDLGSIVVHHSRPPTILDLPTAASWWTRSVVDPVRSFSQAHAGWIGFAGVLLGAVVAHFAWKP